ncbi:MAG: cobalt transporter [Phenylobacterium sp.]|uniref:cation transporter n=1 Tax=Phenylobacterium sp. TaxID=1871053 RepID=UPI0025DF838E|nr:cation transporter [Phenylobacterium sp.]MBI1200293.1 cobalt transporter [Phenylobacterium sp.]
MKHVPQAIEADLKHARALELWTLFWQLSIVAVMFFAMGSSQAMKSAWVEDVLGMVPATVFLVALHFEQKAPTEKFPFGFARVNSLAFLIASAALIFMGLYLIYDGGMKLVRMEHPTIGAAPLLGPDVWMGWVMLAALAYSTVPPIILGRLKQPVAKRLQDKVLHTDALMQKADWMTGVAGGVGILGVGFGWWWADSAAAVLIAVDIVNDGRRALTIATAELIDGAPRELGRNAVADEARSLRQGLQSKFGADRVRLRESGRFILAEVDGGKPPAQSDPEALWSGDQERRWRLADVTATVARR